MTDQIITDNTQMCINQAKIIRELESQLSNIAIENHYILQNANAEYALNNAPTTTQLLNKLKADAVRECADAIYPKDTEIPASYIDQYDSEIRWYADNLEEGDE